MKRTLMSLLIAVMTGIGLMAADAENIFITGDAIEKGWTFSNPEDTRLVQQPDGLYKWSGKMTKEGRFRFLTQQKWYPTYTTAEASHQTVSQGTYPITYDVTARAGEPSFRIGASGEYTITIDLEAMTMNINLDKADENEKLHIYLTGDAAPCGWTTGNAIELTDLGDNRYTWTGDLTKQNDGRFRFLTGKTWYPTYTTTLPEHELVKAGVYALTYYETGPKGEPSFKVEVPGNYTIDLDINAMTMTLTLNSAIEEKHLYLLGNATTGADLTDGEAIPAQELHLTGENIYEWKGDLYDTTDSGNRAWFVLSPDPESGVTYTCRLDMAGDEEVFPGETYDLFERNSEEQPDNRFYPSVQGNYSFMVDTRLMTMTVNRNKSELYLVGGSVTGGNAPWAFNSDYLAKMTETDPLVFEWTGFLHATTADGKTAKFKFLTSSSAWAGFVNGGGEDTTVAYDSTYPLLDSTKPGSGDFQFIVPADGMYRLVVDTRALTLTVTDGTSGTITTEAENGVGMRIDSRTLSFTGADAAGITVYDISGRIVASSAMAEGSLNLPAAGIYVVRINETATKIAVK